MCFTNRGQIYMLFNSHKKYSSLFSFQNRPETAPGKDFAGFTIFVKIHDKKLNPMKALLVQRFIRGGWN